MIFILYYYEERKSEMNLMKNSLLIIIIIESMVLLQLLVLDKRVNMHMFKHGGVSLDTKVVKLEEVKPIQTYVFTVEKEKELQKFILESKKQFNSFMSENNELDFLYSKESYLKMTESIEVYAKNFLNAPYVWGAIGPDKFDCSGFTKKIYSQSGITIPRHSSHQAKVGKYVKYEDLKKGDMVFFDTNHKLTGKVNHVGIYLEDGKFIHASSGNKKVVITNFNEKKFYKNRFLWGRRVVEPKVLDVVPTFSTDGIKYFLGLIT